MLNEKYIQYLIKKQQQEPLSPEEAETLDAWYQSLEDLPTEISSPASLREETWQRLERRIRPKPLMRRLRWPISAAAAGLLLFGTGYLLNRAAKPALTAVHSWTVVECPPHKRMKISMPDGSAIWLNGGARLEYDAEFAQNRQCRLTEGEAFFDVAPDAMHPFTVRTSRLIVKVLGTSFNVSAYKRLQKEKITVSGGSVQVLDSGACNVTLRANEEIVYSSASDFAKRAASGWQTDSWRNGEFYLANISMEELAIRLEQIYGYKVVFASKGLKNCVNSLRFSEREPVTKVLELLKLINKVEYQIKDNEITLRGSGC
ncbi:FecR family protein [Chitinophaga lutea]